jgi:hypothetical protein
MLAKRVKHCIGDIAGPVRDIPGAAGNTQPGIVDVC